MPARRKPIEKRFALDSMIRRELAKAPQCLKPRLHAILVLYEDAGTRDTAQFLGRSRRTVQRWLSVWNGRGPDALLRWTKRGPKRQISREEFFTKLHPLILAADGREMPIWSLAEVQRRLAQSKEIQVSYATLRRTFQRYGFRPKRRPRKLPPPPRAPQDWNYPWSPEYGTCLTDLLARQEAARGALDGGKAVEEVSDLRMKEAHQGLPLNVNTTVPAWIASPHPAENGCAQADGEHEFPHDGQPRARKEGGLVPASFRPYPLPGLPDHLVLDEDPDLNLHEPASRNRPSAPRTRATATRWLCTSSAGATGLVDGTHSSGKQQQQRQLT